MVNRTMRIDSRVADEVYIKRGYLALEDVLLFSLYLFSCIAKHVTTLKQLRLLSCLGSLDMNFELFVLITISHCCYQYQLRPTPPVALERVANNVPDFQCTGCIV